MGFSRYLDKISYDFLLQSQFFTREEIYRLQLEGLQDLIKFAKQHTKFYKDYPDITELEMLKELPVITKVTVKQNLEKMHPNFVPCHNKWTGGTTCMIELYYPNFTQITDAHERFKSWYPKGSEGREVIVWGWGELSGLQGITKPTIRGNELYMPIQGMSNPNTVRDYLRQIMAFHPSKIRGYASSLIALAHEQMGKDPIPSLKVIVNNCEPIIPQTRKLIEGTFQVPLFNFYGSQDLGVMAQSCEQRDELHINAERYILRSGEHGEFIWTDLINYATILVNYKNDDTGILSDKQSCPCKRGLPMIKDITGRTLYWLWLKDGNWLNSTEIHEYMYYFVSGHLHLVHEHQIVQEEQGKADLLINPWDKNDMPDYGGLVRHFAELGLDVTVKVVDEVKRSGPTAKLLSCITRFKPIWEMER